MVSEKGDIFNKTVFGRKNADFGALNRLSMRLL